MFNSSVYLLAEQKGVLLKLGNTINSIFSGSEDNKAPLQFEYVDDKNEISYIHNFQIPSADFTLRDNHKQARILFSKNSFFYFMNNAKTFDCNQKILTLINNYDEFIRN